MKSWNKLFYILKIAELPGGTWRLHHVRKTRILIKQKQKRFIHESFKAQPKLKRNQIETDMKLKSF